MNDCGDKSDEDEDDCDYEEDDASTQCDLETEFECVGNLRKKCISIDEVCDGTNDCDVSITRFFRLHEESFHKEFPKILCLIILLLKVSIFPSSARNRRD